MKVILTEKVPSLGNVGEIVNVNPGYGRNYLVPNRKAVLANEANQKELENQKRALQKKVAEEKAAAEALKKQIDGLNLEFARKVGGTGKLFGTVTNTELAKVLAEKSIEVERRLIVIETPIKTLGEFPISVKLFSGVEASFTVKVVMDQAQAEEEKAKRETAEKRKAEKAAEAKLKAADADVEAEKAEEVENENQTEEEIKEFEQN